MEETTKTLVPILKTLGFKQIVTRQDRVMYFIPGCKVVEFFNGSEWTIWVKK